MPDQFAVSASTTLNLRSSPSTSGDNIIAALPHGQIVTKVADAAAPFVKVRTILNGDTITGFCSQDFLVAVTPSGTGSAAVITKLTIKDGVEIKQLASGKAVFFTSDMDIDVDGAPNAYGPSDSGLELNVNGKNSKGQWVGVVTDDNGDPVKQGPDDPFPGKYISTTTLQDTTKPVRSTLRYVNAVAVPYIVLPGQIVGGQLHMGDPALVIDTKTGVQVKAIVADSGPTTKTGEASAMLAALISKQDTSKKPVGAPKSFSSPRSGGTDERRYRYIVFPGQALTWPQTVDAINAAVDAAVAGLNGPERAALGL